MDDLKTLAQGLLVAGMVFVWPGPELFDVLKRERAECDELEALA